MFIKLCKIILTGRSFLLVFFLEVDNTFCWLEHDGSEMTFTRLFEGDGCAGPLDCEVGDTERSEFSVATGFSSSIWFCD